MHFSKTKAFILVILVVTGLVQLNLYQTWKELGNLKNNSPAIEVNSSTPIPVSDKSFITVTNVAQESGKIPPKLSEKSSMLGENDLTSPVPPTVDVPASFALPFLTNETNKEMAADLASISRDFSQEMSNSRLSPYDSRYLTKWNEAKEKAEMRIRQLYGQELLNKLQTISPAAVKSN
jgi:hypothetical protein